MSRSGRRAAKLACLTNSCGLGPRSARNRSLAPFWSFRALPAAGFQNRTSRVFHTARSATTCVASRRVAVAYGVAHLALTTPFYVQNTHSYPQPCSARTGRYAPKSAAR